MTNTTRDSITYTDDYKIHRPGHETEMDAVRALRLLSRVVGRDLRQDSKLVLENERWVIYEKVYDRGVTLTDSER